jgi:sulfite reductase alpha subunit-like flavoprotein
LDPDFVKKAAKETGMTIADALLRFPKARPPLPALLAMIPKIKPRAYFIASAPLASESIELLMLIETWWCDAGMPLRIDLRHASEVETGAAGVVSYQGG